MYSPILVTAEIARSRFVQGEIEAGLVFADAAIEFQYSKPTRSAACCADAEDCHATAINLIRQAGSTQPWPLELETMLVELQRRLDLLHGSKMVTSAAA